MFLLLTGLAASVVVEETTTLIQFLPRIYFDKLVICSYSVLVHNYFIRNKQKKSVSPPFLFLLYKRVRFPL